MLIALLLVGLSLAGCADRTEPAPTVPSGEPMPMPHLRRIGPDDQGREVVLRFGDRLDVTPASRPDGWVVAAFPSGILRLHGGAGAASSHTFFAISIGEGQLVLTPAAPPAGDFTVRIRVLRDTVQPPQP